MRLFVCLIKMSPLMSVMQRWSINVWCDVHAESDSQLPTLFCALMLLKGTYEI